MACNGFGSPSTTSALATERCLRTTDRCPPKLEKVRNGSPRSPLVAALLVDRPVKTRDPSEIGTPGPHAHLVSCSARKPPAQARRSTALVVTCERGIDARWLMRTFPR